MNSNLKTDYKTRTIREVSLTVPVTTSHKILYKIVRTLRWTRRHISWKFNFFPFREGKPLPNEARDPYVMGKNKYRGWSDIRRPLTMYEELIIFILCFIYFVWLWTIEPIIISTWLFWSFFLSFELCKHTHKTRRELTFLLLLLFIWLWLMFMSFVYCHLPWVVDDYTTLTYNLWLQLWEAYQERYSVKRAQYRYYARLGDKSFVINKFNKEEQLHKIYARDTRIRYTYYDYIHWKIKVLNEIRLFFHGIESKINIKISFFLDLIDPVTNELPKVIGLGEDLPGGIEGSYFHYNDRDLEQENILENYSSHVIYIDPTKVIYSSDIIEDFRLFKISRENTHILTLEEKAKIKNKTLLIWYKEYLHSQNYENPYF